MVALLPPQRLEERVAVLEDAAARERTLGQVEEAITDMAVRGYTPVQIQRELPAVINRLAKQEGWPNWKLPSLRTIQRISKKAGPSNPSEPWRIEDSPAPEARLLLDFVAEVTTQTQGRVSRLSSREAPWIARLLQLGPPMEWANTLMLARHYAELRESGRSTAELDAFLAFAPWRDEDHLRTFIDALDNGWLGEPGRALWAAGLFAGPPKRIRENWSASKPRERDVRRAAAEVLRRFSRHMHDHWLVNSSEAKDSAQG
jgi:hypothetical protein